MSKQVFVSTKLLNLKGKYAPSMKPAYHSDRNCGMINKIGFTGFTPVTEQNAKELDFQPCFFCSKDRKAVAPKLQNAKEECLTRHLNEFKEFIAPLSAPTDTSLTLPITCTETLTLNGIKYIRADKCPSSPTIKGLIVMDDGKEYSLI